MHMYLSSACLNLLVCSFLSFHDIWCFCKTLSLVEMKLKTVLWEWWTMGWRKKENYIYIYIFTPSNFMQINKVCCRMSNFNISFSLNFRFKTSSRCSPDWEVYPWVWWIWPLRLLLDAGPHFSREEEEPAQTLHFHACWWTRKPGKAGQWRGRHHGWPQQKSSEQKVDLVLWDLQCS